MKISVSRLAGHVHCPRNQFLWDRDDARFMFYARARAFRTAILTYLSEGYDTGAMVLNHLVESATRPQMAGVFRNTLVALAAFHTYVTEHGIRFRQNGTRAKATVGDYTISVDLKLVEELPDGSLAGWVLFDYADRGLNEEQLQLIHQIIRWILARDERGFTQAVFYVPDSGAINRVAVDPTDALWDARVILPLAHAAVYDHTYPKKPGPHCTTCWHLKKGTCDAAGTVSRGAIRLG